MISHASYMQCVLEALYSILAIKIRIILYMSQNKPSVCVTFWVWPSDHKVGQNQNSGTDSPCGLGKLIREGHDVLSPWDLPRARSLMLGAVSAFWLRRCSVSLCDSWEGGTEEDAEEEEDEEEEAGLDLGWRSFSLRRFSGVTVSGFTGAGCSVAGVTGKKLSLVSFVCFGVVGISAVDCIKHKREGRDSEKYMPVILHLLPASVTTAGSTTSCRQKTLTNKKSNIIITQSFSFTDYFPVPFNPLIKLALEHLFIFTFTMLYLTSPSQHNTFLSSIIKHKLQTLINRNLFHAKVCWQTWPEWTDTQYFKRICKLLK